MVKRVTDRDGSSQDGPSQDGSSQDGPSQDGPSQDRRSQDLISSLVADLRAESVDLDAVVGGLSAGQWRLPTPAVGWDIADAIGHLGSTDEAAVRSVTDPESFPSWVRSVVLGDLDAYLASHLIPARTMSAAELLAWWRVRRDGLAECLERLDPGVRLPWFGPPMSGPAFVVARLMETWAHGVDITDALGLPPSATSRLRHVADLGYRTRGWSYVVRDQTMPPGDVYLELNGPTGEVWNWGALDAASSVRGKALDFCLVVTQRRHLSDTDLRADGDLATEWLSIAQAFAGMAGPGREPLAGQRIEAGKPG